MKILMFFTGCIIITMSAYTQSKDEIAVRDVLSGQIAAWNKGNLKNFMESYWANDSLQFVGKSGLTYGWTATLEHYKKNYPDTTAMGKLDFTLIEVKQLSPLYIFVTGKWHLIRTVGDLNGHFTLLFKKIENRWVIITDHSS